MVDPHSEHELKQLVEASKTGSEDAFYKLYNMLQQPMFGFIASRTNSREDAKDVLQLVFVDVWRSLPKFSYVSDRALYGFVYKIARRKLARYYKEQERVVELGEEHMKENYEMINSEATQILPVMQKLKPKYREVLELRYWSSLPFADIAKFLKVRETTVKVRHHRALKKLKTLIAAYETGY